MDTEQFMYCLHLDGWELHGVSKGANSKMFTFCLFSIYWSLDSHTEYIIFLRLHDCLKKNVFIPENIKNISYHINIIPTYGYFLTLEIILCIINFCTWKFSWGVLIKYDIWKLFNLLVFNIKLLKCFSSISDCSSINGQQVLKRLKKIC